MKLTTILLNLAKRIKTSFTRLTTLETWQSDTADYIVEQGTSGAWVYRKWNSGIAECWGEKTETLSHYASMGSGQGIWWNYYSDFYYPFTFTEVPIVFAGNNISSAFTITTIIDTAVFTDHVRVYCTNHVLSGSQRVVSRCHVIGKWK